MTLRVLDRVERSPRPCTVPLDDEAACDPEPFVID